jgi:nucleotide-binding universal stress UspA family protein
MLRIQKIVAPVDFDPASGEALDHAVQLAARFGASVCAVHVYAIPVYGFPDGAIITSPELAAKLSEVAQKHLDDAVAARQGRGVPLTGLLLTGDASEEIVKAAESEKADLVVMGTHGRRGMARALLGSVAEHVLRTSKIPVLVVPAVTGPK